MVLLTNLQMMQNLSYESEDPISESDEESYYSDKVNSDIEAELYSTLHYEEVTSLCHSKIELQLQKTADCSSTEFKWQNSKHTNDELIDMNSNLHDECFPADMANTNCESLEIFNNDKYYRVDNSASSKKRKSDLIASVLEDIQANPTDDQLNKTKEIFNKFQPISDSGTSSHNNSNPVVPLESSDSDSSIILLGPDDQSKLQLNVDEMIVIDSDSDNTDSESFSFSLPPSNNVISPNSSFADSLKDPWHIDAEDLYRTKKRTYLPGRYHEKAISNCSNCNQIGHIAKQCLEQRVVKCFLCGGKHLGSKCKNKMCSRCLRYGHFAKYCRMRLIDTCCDLCTMAGHIEKDCPDLWRRFHLTEDANRKKLVKGKTLFQNTPIYCCNCGYEGHVYTECRKPRMDKWVFPTWPSVISYGGPKEIAAIQQNKKRRLHKKGNHLAQSQIEINQELKNRRIIRKEKWISKRNAKIAKLKNLKWNVPLDSEINGIQCSPDTIKKLMKKERKRIRRREQQLAMVNGVT